jgi:predicted alpha/beta superfamily hydrolase
MTLVWYRVEVIPAVKKTPSLFSTYPVSVPSLSWETDRFQYKMERRKECFFFRAPEWHVVVGEGALAYNEKVAAVTCHNDIIIIMI